MELNHITLDQWRTLVSLVDTGGYAQAATALHKSQSAVTYAIQKMEQLLDIKVVEIQGRKAVLTPTGQFLYRRARALLADAAAIERAAKRLSAGWEAELRIAAEIIFPSWLLLDCLGKFGDESPQTRIELVESVLGGTTEALLRGEVDMAIANHVPPGFLGEQLIRLRFIPVAHPDYPLHQLGRPLTMQDLRAHRHVVIRETGSRRTTNALSLEATQRWTVSHSATSLEAVRRGHGFAWFPEEKILSDLQSGHLRELPLRDGGDRFTDLYLILADPDSAGPGARRLAEIIRVECAAACRQRMPETGSNASRGLMTDAK